MVVTSKMEIKKRLKVELYCIYSLIHPVQEREHAEGFEKRGCQNKVRHDTKNPKA